MFKTILTAYDGSESASKAYTLALDLAGKYQARLTVIAVARPPEPPEDIETEAILETAQQHYEADFAAMKHRAMTQSVAAAFDVVAGHPAEQIVYAAERHGADLIVMGHRGRTFFDRWLLGSVAKQVMSYSPCAVLIVR